MYESPIDIVYKEIQTQIKEQFEKQVFEAVQQCEIYVDKDALINALKYDRGQYTKGYEDAKRKILDKLLIEITDMKIKQDSENMDYKTGFICALSNVEGVIAILEGGKDGENTSLIPTGKPVGLHNNPE